ncbi:MAG TPA: outer membrane beta-barrel protein [Pyrinomonadaceae bacterium]|nr:outer membrane beta-barrel protein [Pyrinomonadaceae bacterium]
MRKLLVTTFLIACSASVLMGQTPDQQTKNEFFAGYSFHSADINTLTVDPRRRGQHGVNLEYTRNVTKHVGITADASAHFYRDTRSTSVGTFSSKRDQYFLLGGLQFKPGHGKGIRPFAHVLFGASLFRGFTSDLRPTGNVYTFDDATSVAMAFGGGLDVRLNQRIDLRLIQADYTPTFFGSGRQNNFRLSVGIILKK